MLKLKLQFSNPLLGGYLVHVHPSSTSPSRINGSFAIPLRKITVNSFIWGTLPSYNRALKVHTHSGQIFLFYERPGKPLESHSSFLNNKCMFMFTWFLRISHSWCFHSGAWTRISTAFWWSRDVFAGIRPNVPSRPHCIQNNLILVLLGTGHSCQFPPEWHCLHVLSTCHPCLFQGFSESYLLSCVSFTTRLSLESSTRQLRTYKTE